MIYKYGVEFWKMADNNLVLPNCATLTSCPRMEGKFMEHNAAIIYYYIVISKKHGRSPDIFSMYA